MTQAMNYHKNDENTLTTKLLKGAKYHMNIIESLKSFLQGSEERAMHKLLASMKAQQASNGWYRRFTGRSKTFKKNQRKGL